MVKDALRLHELYRNRILEELRGEIIKGWDSLASMRSVKDIINTGTKARKAKMALSLFPYKLSEKAFNDLVETFEYLVDQVDFYPPNEISHSYAFLSRALY